MSETATSNTGLVLVGYRGTGKSTVGRIVAEKLGREFVDADAALELQAGRPVRLIFAEQGEHFFREAEERVLRQLTAIPGRVIATGGGAVLRESNRRVLSEYGHVVWLSASVDALKKRLEADPENVVGRPALTALGTLDEIAHVLNARLPFYRAVSHVEISTEGRSPLEVAEAAIASLPIGVEKRGGASS